MTAPATLRDRTATGPSAPAARRTPKIKVLKRLPVQLLVALLLIVEIYPLVWLFMGSFKTQDEFLNSPVWTLPQNFSFDNYTEAWTTGNLATYVGNSLIATIPSLFLIVLFGVAAGFALEVLVWKGRNAVLLTFLAGIMVPGQMILLPLFSAYFQVGLTGTLWPLIITYTATGLPLTVFMMATYFRAVPREVFEAATLDGASMVRAFFSIGFPMVRNAVFTVALVQFFFIWNDLLIALTFTNNAQLNTIQVGLLNFTGEFGAVQYGPLFAAICINVFGTLVLYLFLNQRVMKGLAGGAVKG
ncbi:raffinose/stachyose/melibiose transport system permease protein [Arthrobacter sp. PvP102]|uniref:carbohydrate ABC transporter permease n=1 Tax=unclassified Arthrobacter TaxID=235627 RepID=UPI001AE2B92F|nr:MULTISPECIES: carbohydrate ABC transporter permease [unclassified Arthrobacter]MBP1235319.1 raffinose/stachyose/melibiose transport system permease protein [Arthrobacter sp. PvP103]MBP1236278.1 raffinose/stachyose/melibiose transport system permease protein [Arthrobacter sp. PvP102]